VAEMCPNHKMATIFKKRNVVKKFKNPHKIDFLHIWNISKKEMWRLEPLVYIANNPFTTFPHFF